MDPMGKVNPQPPAAVRRDCSLLLLWVVLPWRGEGRVQLAVQRLVGGAASSLVAQGRREKERKKKKKESGG